ncbi:MAG: ABC transporter permease [Chitinophagales bacterium]
MSEQVAHKEREYLSPNEKALKRLLKNRPAVGGFIVIVLAVLIAVFGYLLTPDSTPYANDQVLEIATEPPGFEIDMLKVRKNRAEKDESFLTLLMTGRENLYKLVPIKEYEFDSTNIIVHRYTGSANTADIDTFNLVEVVYPVSAAENNIRTNGQEITFLDLEEKEQKASIAALQTMVKENHIEEKSYVLGTDKFGRDTLSRLILGVRISLSIGLMAVLISLIIGITIGAIGGYFGGVVDDMVMWLINVFWSIPLLLLVFALVLTLGRDFWQIYLAVGLTMWVEVARIVRGQILSLREQEYVEAAKSLGFGHVRIITRHILPNIVGPLVVVTAANFASAIIIEAGLSFLGIGVQPPTPSWGTMLNEYRNYIGTDKAYLALFPGIAISVMVLAFNLLGNGLRDALDVKTQV